MSVWDGISPAEQAALSAEQESLEIKSIDLGIARYQTERYGTTKSQSWPEQKIIGDGLRTLIPAVYDLQKRAAAGKPARGVSFWGVPLLTLPADKIAFITLIEMVDAADFGERSAIVKVALGIGNRVKVEREYALIREDYPDVFKFMKSHAKNWNRRTHYIARRKASRADTGWDQRTKVWIGSALIELALNHTRLFTLRKFNLEGKTRTWLILRDDTRDAIEREHSHCEVLRPFYLPMVVPPKTWEDQTSGGYIFHRVRLVKLNLQGNAQDERLYEAMPRVLASVNALQATEFRINQRIYSVMSQLWTSGGGWAFRDKSGRELMAEPLPVPPPTFDWGSTPKELKQEWKLRASKIHDENARLGSKRKAMIHKLWIANLLKTRKVLYFPHQLDWRGRAYPLASHLHPQSDDPGRSLLEFAEGRRLGKRGLYWLKIHLANCFGIKASFSERTAWVDAHLSSVRESARNPIDFRWWAGAEKCWQALATCMELADATADSASHVSVQVDGTCNGLQHFSAMGRDEIGGRLVNLVPMDQPQDVYESISAKVNQLIKEEIQCQKDLTTHCSKTHIPTTTSGIMLETWKNTPTTSNEKSETSSKSTRTSTLAAAMSRKWMGLVTRKTVKRPTMTIVYGLTKPGMQRQYIQDGWCESFREAEWLARHTWVALDGALVQAALIMEWLRGVAALASSAGVAVRWVTPVGFLVIQEYLEQSEQHLYTALQKITIRQPNPDKGISTHRQVRGLPPNFVHSFDAAHMMLTVLNCVDRGITSFSMIHDSFGTHACQIDELGAALREEFVGMYSEPLLPILHRAWSLETSTELPQPPQPGNLDLNVVIDSPFFFG